MVSVICFLTIVVLLPLSLTRKRIYVVCGFYSVFALLTVMAGGGVPRLGPVTVYQAIYLILAVSLSARFVHDRTFLFQARRWPLAPYIFLLVLLLVSALYSYSGAVFASENSEGLWNRIVVFLLFWAAASHVHEANDLKIFAGATVAVSLIMSAWVIWNAAQFNFEALRGGIDVNQNYVSVFVLMGAIPLINFVFEEQNNYLRLFCLPGLLLMVLASLILASRGMIAATLVAFVLMAGRLFRKLGFKTMLSLCLAMILVLTLAMSLPGAGSFFARFQEDNLGTLNDRTLMWSHSLRYFADSGIAGMIFGHGLSSGRTILGPVLPDYANYHNEYLRWLMDQGVVGLIGLLVFLYSVARRVASSGHRLKNVMIGWLAFLSVAGMTSTISDVHLFWIVLGIVVGAAPWAEEPGRFSQPTLQRLPRTSASVAQRGSALG